MSSCFALLISIFVLINVESCLSKDLELLILHNNDIHARFEETSKLSGQCKTDHRGVCYGGMARTAHVIREARKAAQEGTGPKVLFLNAGDTYTGTAWFNVHKWKIVTEFMNALKPDAVSFGNHEFDQRVEGIVPFVNGAEFPVVAANLEYSNEPEFQKAAVEKSVVLEIEGKKIGIIGFVTPETAHISAPGKIEFLDEVVSIKEESERLDKQGVKIIIALGHSGYETDKRIAREVPLVDLVVGGHTNTFLWNGAKPDSEEPNGPYPTVVTQNGGKKVPIVQAYAYTKYIGQLKITFDDNGNAIAYSGQPLLLDNQIPQEQDVLDILEKYRPEVEALNEEVVGRSRVILDGSTESCRFRDCNFGNFITDAYAVHHAAMYAGSYWTDAPIAIVNGGSIRSTIEPKSSDGSITRGELMGAMPFADQLISMNLKGADLLQTLELAVRSNGETSRGELLQVSGILYSADLSKPVGSRITAAKVLCNECLIPTYEPLDPNREYRIITTGFLNGGGDGHSIIKEKGTEKAVEDLSDIDTVIWYMTKLEQIYPEEQERILVKEGENPDPEPEPEDDDGAGEITLASTLLIAFASVVSNILR